MSQDTRVEPLSDGNPEPDRRQHQRRQGDVDVVTRIEFEERLIAFRNSTVESVNTRFQLLGDQILTKLDDLDRSIKNGFPNGDQAEHRREHERQIKIAEDRQELYRQVREKVITSGIWGFLVLLGLASWEFIKKNIQ